MKDRIIEQLEDFFNVCEGEPDQNGNIWVELESYTENGGDQIFTIWFEDEEEMNDLRAWKREIATYIEDFDPLAEAMLWVDETGQGVNGTPGNVITLHDDYCRWRENVQDFIGGLS